MMIATAMSMHRDDHKRTDRDRDRDDRDRDRDRDDRDRDRDRDRSRSSRRDRAIGTAMIGIVTIDGDRRPVIAVIATTTTTRGVTYRPKLYDARQQLLLT